MENLTLQQLINQTKEALIEAGASNYYQNVFKTLSKQLLLYAKEHDAESFSMDFGLQFLEDHYSMSSKIEQKKWCATYSRCINALAEYQHSGNVTLYRVMDKRVYTFPDSFKDSAEAYLSHREKTGITQKSNKVFSLYLERFAKGNDTAHLTPHILHHVSKCGNEPKSIAVHHGTFQHQYDAELLRTHNFRNVNNRNEAADCIVVNGEFTTPHTTFEHKNIRGYKKI